MEESKKAPGRKPALSFQDIDSILEQRQAKLTLKKIANELSLSITTIWRVCKGIYPLQRQFEKVNPTKTYQRQGGELQKQEVAETNLDLNCALNLKKFFVDRGYAWAEKYDIRQYGEGIVEVKYPNSPVFYVKKDGVYTRKGSTFAKEQLENRAWMLLSNIRKVTPIKAKVEQTLLKYPEKKPYKIVD